tara:strand:- start:1490 stop:1612 length:123 start_codon:yes stop_codon:yes gene_type:complete
MNISSKRDFFYDGELFFQLIDKLQQCQHLQTRRLTDGHPF